MEKRISKTNKFDRLILADSKKLLEHSDKSNLYSGVAKVIEDLYHQDWFPPDRGKDYFTPPTIHIEDGVVKFINGRHRTLLLSKYLDEFPLLVGNLDFDCDGETPTTKSIHVLNEITVDQFTEHSIFNKLPDLEFGAFPKA